MEPKFHLPFCPNTSPVHIGPRIIASSGTPLLLGGELYSSTSHISSAGEKKQTTFCDFSLQVHVLVWYWEVWWSLCALFRNSLPVVVATFDVRPSTGEWHYVSLLHITLITWLYALFSCEGLLFFSIFMAAMHVSVPSIEKDTIDVLEAARFLVAKCTYVLYAVS